MKPSNKSKGQKIKIDKLMIVAHPDDEVLWGGANLLAEAGWYVVVATNGRHSKRKIEFFKTMSNAGVYKATMYNVKDIYTTDRKVSDNLFKGTPFEKALKRLAKKSWKLVLTHNSKGEYGHEHHKSVGRLVKKLFSNVKRFALGNKLSSKILSKKRLLMQWYRQTQDLPRFIYERKLNEMSNNFTRFYTHEKIYVKQTKLKIPPIIHQIWFGSKPPKVKQYLLNNVKKNGGVDYKLWGNKDLTFKNFPLTWDTLQKILLLIKQGEPRWAQVADLARYEIIYRYGGVYLDSLFEVSSKLWPAILNIKSTFVGANEDPCGLECKSDGRYYLSNGFFAAIPRHQILTYLVNDQFLNNIDIENPHINTTTGPFALRAAIKNPKQVKLLSTFKIYPSISWNSFYRKANKNKCVVTKKSRSRSRLDCVAINNKQCLVKDCLTKYYPNALAVYQSGLGGTWIIK